MRFLIIDDEQFARNTLKRLLSFLDAEIIEADNAYDGYTLVKEKFPDIVFCDIMMNEIGGDWLIEKLMDTIPQANIIVVSGQPKEKLLKYELMGAKAIITKPIKYNLLMAEVDKIIERK